MIYLSRTRKSLQGFKFWTREALPAISETLGFDFKGGFTCPRPFESGYCR